MVLVCFGFYSKKYHRPGDLNNKHSLTVLYPEKSKINAPAGLVPADNGLFPGSQTAIFLLCFHMEEMGKEALQGLFYKGTNSIK